MDHQLRNSPITTKESSSDNSVNNSTDNVTNDPNDPNLTSDEVAKQKIRSRKGKPKNPLLDIPNMKKLHRATYLFSKKTKKIYEMDLEKRRRIILSSQLSLFGDHTPCPLECQDDCLNYCVVCKKSVPNSLQKVFEHWCSSQHNEYLTIIEEEDKQFSACPTQFSSLTLSKEFMIENQCFEESSESYLMEFECRACDVTVPDQDSLVREHFQSEDHQTKIARFKRRSEKICKEIFPMVVGSWYSIEKFSCRPCKKINLDELSFGTHVGSHNHFSTVQSLSVEDKKNYYFDSCAICGLLWFGDEDEYSKHCYQDTEHYNLTRFIELTDIMPEEASNLFFCFEEVITDLMEEVNEIRYDETRENELIKSLELTMRRKFRKAKAYLFGSRITGLGLRNCDIDLFLDCGVSYGSKSYHSEDLYHRVYDCLKRDWKTWTVEGVIINKRNPIIKLCHIHSRLKCDVTFSNNGLSVESTKLLKSYIDAYAPCKEMILFIKKWLSLCKISGSQHLKNYAVSWFVIFFLQTKNILPSVASLMKDNPNLRTIAGWSVGIKEVIVSEESQNLSTRELLKEFFCFYADFNYKYNLACPLLGKIMLKKEFVYLKKLNKEMKPYVKQVKSEIDPEFFRIDSPMCIQDPYYLSDNLTKHVSKEFLNRFRKLCYKAAQLLSSDQDF